MHCRIRYCIICGPALKLAGREFGATTTTTATDSTAALAIATAPIATSPYLFLTTGSWKRSSEGAHQGSSKCSRCWVEEKTKLAVATGER